MELYFRNAHPNIENLQLRAASYCITYTVLTRAELGKDECKNPKFVVSMRRQIDMFALGSTEYMLCYS